MPKILVVADEPWVVNDIKAALSAEYDITEVSDPRSVVEVSRDSRPDAVIVDLQVGSMGGMAVTRSLRDAAATSGDSPPPIILLLDRVADSFLAGRSGAHDWLKKPFNSFELRDAVDQLIQARTQSA